MESLLALKDIYYFDTDTGDASQCAYAFTAAMLARNILIVIEENTDQEAGNPQLIAGVFMLDGEDAYEYSLYYKDLSEVLPMILYRLLVDAVEIITASKAGQLHRNLAAAAGSYANTLHETDTARKKDEELYRITSAHLNIARNWLAEYVAQHN